MSTLPPSRRALGAFAALALVSLSACSFSAASAASTVAVNARISADEEPMATALASHKASLDLKNAIFPAFVFGTSPIRSFPSS